MEPIKAAIEKARKQRENAGVYRFTQGASSRVQEEPRPKHIEYTETYVHDVSRAELVANRIIAQEKKHGFADAYRMLRAQVLSKLRKNGWSTLGVTSAGPGQGKSLTSANLAISIARNVNHTVMLIDFDLRRPNIRHLFNYEREYGLINCLRDETPIRDVLFTPSLSGLVVLPGGEPVDESSELLETVQAKRLVQEVKERYQSRVVIFDMPPMLVNDDVFAAMPLIDSMLFVVEEGKTRREDVRQCMELLKGHNLLGTVLNKSRDKASSTGYNTPYY